MRTFSASGDTRAEAVSLAAEVCELGGSAVLEPKPEYRRGYACIDVEQPHHGRLRDVGVLRMGDRIEEFVSPFDRDNQGLDDREALRGCVR